MPQIISVDYNVR